MAATIERIVQATVTKTSAAVSRLGFGTVLGVHQISTAVQTSRFKTYSTLTELTDAGFLTTDLAFQWAAVIFSQNPRPIQVALGRRVPGVAEVHDVQITAPEVGSWGLAVDDGSGPVPYAFIADSGDTNISIAEGLRVQIAQDPTATVVVPSVATGTDTFTVTAGIAGTTHTVVLTPPGAGTGTTAITTANTAPENITTALTAIETENLEGWYYFTIDTRTEVDILEAATFAGARAFEKFYLAQTKDSDMPLDVTPNVGSQLGALNFDNVWLGWYESDLDFHDAGMAGVAAAADLDSEGGVITWALKELKAVAASDLTSSEINNILANSGNVYIEISGLSITNEGFAVSGEFADTQTTMAWAKARVQEAVFAALATNPTKVPYTDAGITVVTNAFLGVLRTGVSNGHFSSDNPDLPRVTAPLSSQISLADKNARILRNVIGEAQLAGAIHSTLLQILLSV